VNMLLARPDVKGRIAELGGAVFKTSPVEFGKYLADQTAKWASVVRFANIKAQ